MCAIISRSISILPLRATRFSIMPIFTVDGNIGCGKSSVLHHLHMYYRIPVDPEPVEKWEPFLNDIYQSGKGTFEFQVRVWLDRCWVQTRPNMASIVMERSPFFQSNVFIPANLDSGRLTTREFHMLQEMYMKSSSLWAPAGYIYLRSNPGKCMERIQGRGRASESAISLGYIEKLHMLHEQAYMNAVMLGIPVICIDVEGKTIAHIASELWTALSMVGMGTSP